MFFQKWERMIFIKFLVKLSKKWRQNYQLVGSSFFSVRKKRRHSTREKLVKIFLNCLKFHKLWRYPHTFIKLKIGKKTYQKMNNIWSFKRCLGMFCIILTVPVLIKQFGTLKQKYYHPLFLYSLSCLELWNSNTIILSSCTRLTVWNSKTEILSSFDPVLNSLELWNRNIIILCSCTEQFETLKQKYYHSLFLCWTVWNSKTEILSSFVPLLNSLEL